VVGAAAGFVDAEVAGDAQKPRLDSVVAVEPAERGEGAGENLLGHVLGAYEARGEVVDERVNARVITLDQGGGRPGLSRLGVPDQAAVAASLDRPCELQDVGC
jgi:GNAT superfamily N-acetyltransferase